MDHLTQVDESHSAFQEKGVIYSEPVVTRVSDCLFGKRSCVGGPPLPRAKLLLIRTRPYVKVGLVFRLEVQVGAAILIEDSSGRVADSRVLGFVDPAF